MKFYHKQAEQACRKLQCLHMPALCGLIDFCALPPSTFTTTKEPSHRWAYRWRRVLFCAERFLLSHNATDDKLITAAQASPRLRYDEAAKEWKVKGKGGPTYRQEAARLIGRAAGKAMPKVGARKKGMAPETRRRNQLKKLVILALQLERRSREMLHYVATGKRPRSDRDEIPLYPIPSYLLPKIKAPKAPCKSPVKQ